MKSRLVFLSTLILLFGFADASTLDKSVQFVREVVSQMQVANEIQRWTVSEATTPLRKFPNFHEFRVDNWRFAADHSARYLTGNEVTLGGARPGKPTNSRAAGLSEDEVLRLVRGHLDRLGWREGIDYDLRNSIDASHPSLGMMAETQAGMQLVELKRPDHKGFLVHDPAGSFHVQIATGRVVSFSLLFPPQNEQFEDISKLYDLRAAATKARLAAQQLIALRLPRFSEELPPIDTLMANVQREWGIKVINTDPGLTVETYPSSIIEDNYRLANYFFRVGPAGVTVHASSGKVVSGMIAASSGKDQIRAVARPSLGSAGGGGSIQTRSVPSEAPETFPMNIAIPAIIIVAAALGGIIWIRSK